MLGAFGALGELLLGALGAFTEEEGDLGAEGDLTDFRIRSLRDSRMFLPEASKATAAKRVARTKNLPGLIIAYIEICGTIN